MSTEDPEVEREEAPPAEPVGVFVAKTKDADGNINVEVRPVGVDLTEVSTLLELGYASFRQSLGLAPR
jgi:hypothetical protein